MTCTFSVSDIRYLPILFLFMFFLMIDTQRISFAISAPSPSTMFSLPMLDYVIPVFLHWTRVFAVVVIVIFRLLAQFLELSSSR